MKRNFYAITFVLFSFICSLAPQRMGAQCLQLFDGNGNPSASPYWVSCTGGAFTLNLIATSSFGPYTIDWGDGNTDTGPSYTTPAAIVHNYAATTDTFIVTVTTTAPACQISGVVVMEKPVNASIQIPVGGVTTICAPGNMSFTNSSTDVSPTTTFTWDFGDGSPVLTFDATNAGQTITHTYQSGTVSCQTVVTLTAENYCSFGTPTTAQFNPVQIYDKDQVAVTPDAVIKCMPSTTFTFTNNTTRNCLAQGNVGQRYEKWNFHDYWGLGQDSITGWIPWPPSVPQTVTFPGVGTYSVTLIDSSFCGIDSATSVVIVLNAPVAGNAAPVDTACVGTTLTFNNTSTTGYTYRWNFGDNATWTTFPYGNVTHTYTVAGVYTVSVAAIVGAGNASCRDTAQLQVVILAPPTSAFTRTPASDCDTLVVSLTDNSVGAVAWDWKANGVTFSTAQNPPPQTFTTPGTHTISLMVTNSNGCTNTSQQTVTVYKSPVAAFTTSASCQNAITQFTDGSTSLAGDPVVSWNWDFGDATANGTTQNPTHIYTGTGIFTITLNVSTANCSGSGTQTLTVNAKPNAVFSTDVSSGCGPLSVNFTDASTGAATYAWDFGNTTTSSLANPSCTYVNTTTATVNFNVDLIVTSSAGCKDTATTTITVFGKPQASFTSNAVASCSPFTVNFSNTSLAATSYLWDFGDGSATSALTSPSHIFQNTTLFIQNYTVTMIATSANGCTDTTTQVVQAYPEALFSFTMIPDSGCTPLSVSFPSVLGAVSYQWNFGDGTNGTGANPVHLYSTNSTNDTTFTVQLIAVNAFNCVDTTYGTLSVYGKPVASFLESASIGCPPLNVGFLNGSSGFTSSLWNFGDGSATSAVTSPSHIYSNTSTTSAVNVNAQLIVSNAHGCTDTLIRPITIHPDVTASFSADTPICAPVNVVFTNNSSGANSYNWDFGDGNSSSLTAPSHLYTNTTMAAINYTVTLIATNTTTGCDDTASASYNVYPTPSASFTANPPSQVYPATTVTLNNTTANVGVWNYNWTFGDATGSTQQQPGTHVYSTWNTYTITLIASSAFCSDTATQVVTIIPPVPIADFLGSFTGCRPLSVSFTNNSQYDSLATFNWNFGDGGISTQENPSYTYYNAGTYTVSLTVTGPGGTSSVVGVDSVIVYEKPVAYFVATPTTVYIPNTVLTTTNLTTNGNTYVWYFGDGDSSFLFSPTHTYVTEGNYQITLIATSQFGCTDTFNLPTLISAETYSEIQVPNAFTPNPNGPNEDGSYDPASSDNDVFHPVVTGVKKFEMRIYNRWGELLFHTQDVNVGWDGYYKGKMCTQDVYIWKINAETEDDKKIDRAGDVLLLR